MLVFILSLLTAIVWTIVAIKAPYEDSKKLTFICAMLWWVYVILDVFKFIV